VPGSNGSGIDNSFQLNWAKNKIRYAAADSGGISALIDVLLVLGNKKTGTGAGK
jgi:hypothetical protein